MKRSRLFLMGALAIALSYGSAVKAELLDITRPGDPIALVNGTNDGDGNAGAPPGAEGVENSINDTGQKYLNFLDLDSGLAVTPSANPSNLPVIGLRLYSANDAIERDPSSYSLSGSNDAISGPWTLISSGALSLPDGRNPGGATVAIPPSGNLDPAVFSETVLFSNSNSYAHYQLTFPTLKNAGTANSMQIAEIEFLVPEPSGIALLLSGLLGLVARRRR